MSPMFGKKSLTYLLFKLYAIKRRGLRKLIVTIVAKLEGGQMFSETLRKIFSFYHNIEVGKYSYGGCFESGALARCVRIGRYCSFAGGLRIIKRNHPLDYISMHPFFFDPLFGYIREGKMSMHGLEIGNDVWIGHNVLILPNVKSIGDGVAIGAGAVVTRDIPDYAVAVGVPAKVIKYRFTEKMRDEIKKTKWWNKSIEELQKNLDDFTKRLGDDANR